MWKNKTVTQSGMQQTLKFFYSFKGSCTSCCCDQMAVDSHRFGGFLKEKGILRIQISSRQEISRNGICTAALLPGPKMSIVGPDLPWHTLGASPKGYLPNVFTANENNIFTLDQLRFSTVTKDFDPFCIGHSELFKNNGNPIGVGFGIVEYITDRVWLVKVSVHGRGQCGLSFFQARLWVNHHGIGHGFLSDVTKSSDAALLKARNFDIGRQSFPRYPLRGEKIARILEVDIPGSPHERRVYLSRRRKIEYGIGKHRGISLQQLFG